MLNLQPFDAVKTETGYIVRGGGTMKAAFLPVVGIQTLPLDLESEVSTPTGRYEVALALDNTGSMEDNDKIEALREAAGNLVDLLYKKPGADELVKMALVPFVTTVNIKGDAFDPAWIDRSGTGKYADDLFDKATDRVALADKIGYGWKGCVEARAEPYDLDDTAPTSVATKWVPYFWPDEPDGWRNSYLKFDDGSRDWANLINTSKYDKPIRPASSKAIGPNMGCAGPIVELTNDTKRMHDAINAMVPTQASGTNIAQGLVWGWRVLSHEAPFVQGAPYEDEETQKALVLLSDGKNQLWDRAEDAINSDYTGYGFLSQGRLGTKVNGRSAEQNINRKVVQLCKSVKAKNIRLYMILLQENDKKTQQIFEDCASLNDEREVLYYYAPDGDALKKAFAEIGKDLTEIYVSR
jgi:Mg-chelatase subunit ChlD